MIIDENQQDVRSSLSSIDQPPVMDMNPFGRLNIPYNDVVSPELAKLQLIIDDIITTLEMNLEGLEKDSEGNYKKTRKPIMNKDGIDDIMSNVIKPRINRIFILSNFDDTIIKRITLECSIDIACLFFSNYRNYGLDKSQRHLVCNWIVDMIYATLRRALFGNELEALTRTHRVNENINMMPPQQREGFGSTIKNWLKL